MFEQHNHLFFSQGKLCHCRLAVAFPACWKRVFCQGASLTPSLLSEAREENSPRPSSWCSIADALTKIPGALFPGDLSDLHTEEEFPKQGFQLLSWWGRIGLCCEPGISEVCTPQWIVYTLHVLVCNCSYTSCYSYHQE